MLKRLVSIALLCTFTFTSLGPGTAGAQGLFLPAPGTMLGVSPAYMPVMLKGLTVHAGNPLLFDLIVDTGDTSLKPGTADDAAIKSESARLAKYFLASLALPEQDQWVNLSPYEQQRILSPEFGQTLLGRDLLAQDYVLKQVTSSLIYPEGAAGAAFWKKVYERAAKEFGTSDIPMDALNKVWITADKADVYVDRKTSGSATAYVVSAHLKVMLETDYLATSINAMPARGHDAPPADTNERGFVSPRRLPTPQPTNVKATQVSTPTPNPTKVSSDTTPTNVTNDTNAENEIAKNVLREIVIPILEKEVNEGRNFASLRQMFHAMVLAAWYKKNLQDALLNQVYADRKKTGGVQGAWVKDRSVDVDPQAIWQRYTQAFRQGVFNYIKEETDAVTGNMVPRKYFSGGVSDLAGAVREVDNSSSDNPAKGALARVAVLASNPGQNEIPVTAAPGEHLLTAALPVPRKVAILVVDDSPVIVGGISEALERKYPNLTVIKAYSGNSAIALLQDPQFDFRLILTDRQMPDGIGDDIIRHVHASDPNGKISVLMLTGDSDRSLRTTIDAIHPRVGILMKPYNIRDLLGRVDALKPNFDPSEQALFEIAPVAGSLQSTLVTRFSSVYGLSEIAQSVANFLTGSESFVEQLAAPARKAGQSKDATLLATVTAVWYRYVSVANGSWTVESTDPESFIVEADSLEQFVAAGLKSLSQIDNPVARKEAASQFVAGYLERAFGYTVTDRANDGYFISCLAILTAGLIEPFLALYKRYMEAIRNLPPEDRPLVDAPQIKDQLYEDALRAALPGMFRQSKGWEPSVFTQDQLVSLCAVGDDEVAGLIEDLRGPNSSNQNANRDILKALQEFRSRLAMIWAASNGEYDPLKLGQGFLTGLDKAKRSEFLAILAAVATMRHHEVIVPPRTDLVRFATQLMGQLERVEWTTPEIVLNEMRDSFATARSQVGWNVKESSSASPEERLKGLMDTAILRMRHLRNDLENTAPKEANPVSKDQAGIVVVVDDDPRVLEMFNMLGFLIFPGQEVVTLIYEEVEAYIAQNGPRIAIIITDLMNHNGSNKQIDGRVVVEMANKAKIPFVGMSADNVEGVRAFGENYISKSNTFETAKFAKSRARPIKDPAGIIVVVDDEVLVSVYFSRVARSSAQGHQVVTLIYEQVEAYIAKNGPQIAVIITDLRNAYGKNKMIDGRAVVAMANQAKIPYVGMSSDEDAGRKAFGAHFIDKANLSNIIPYALTLARPIADKAQDGGIDINSRNMKLSTQGDMAEFTFDPALAAQLRTGNYNGLTPVVLSVTALADGSLGIPVLRK
ncbi:MAG: response regulator [Candidatus Omnitrophica bacterium]|nr:response regulator [Candidatus Omnitrophota bacterium]